MLSLVIFMVCVSDAFCLVTFDTQTLSKINNHDAEIKELQRVVQVLKSAFIMMGNSYTNMTLQYEQLMDNNRMLEAKLQVRLFFVPYEPTSRIFQLAYLNTKTKVRPFR